MQISNWGISGELNVIKDTAGGVEAKMGGRVSQMWATARPRGRNEWLLILAGINLMLLHFILVQHMVIAIRQDEIAVILFSLSYFSGISLGYALARRFSARWIGGMFPVFLLSQLTLILFAHPAAYAITHDVGEWAAQRGLPYASGEWSFFVLAYLWIMLGATSLYSVFLPAIIVQEEGRLRRCYSMEVGGSLVGLLLLPFLGAISHTALLGAYCLVFVGIAFLSGTRKYIVAILLLISLVFLGNYAAWDRQCSTWVYAQRYADKGVEAVVFSRYTPYHKIEVVKLDDGEHMLLLNGKRQFARGSHFTYSYFVAEYPARLLGDPTVCLVGCGSMSTVGRIGDIVPSITIVDLDREVFNTSRQFFPQYNRINELDNWTFVADDAKHFLANNQDKFDLILHDIPPARSRQTALTYTAEFFSIAKERLTPRGIFSISALSSGANANYGLKMLATLSHVFDHYFALEYRGSYYFFGGGTEMAEPSIQALRDAIEHRGKDRVRVHNRKNIKALTRGITIITTNNVGDLIYD